MAAEVVYERDAGEILDEMRDLSRVNTVMVFFQDFGMYKERDLVERRVEPAGRSGEKVLHVRSDESHFAQTTLRYPPQEADPNDGRDVLDELIAAAEPRGMKVYARSLEPYMTTRRNAPFIKLSEWDDEGRLTGHPCFNHPDYRNYILATYEDLIVQHPQLAGIKFGQERSGPLHDALRGGPAKCFCDYCRALLKERGYSVEKSKDGFRYLQEIGRNAAEGKPRPSDGWMASMLRIFFRYPDMLAHTQLWHDSRESHRKLIYGLVKTLNPHIRVGWHIDHHWCWDLLGRAAIDYADMPAYSDWLSLALYFDSAAGQRMAGHFSRGFATPFLGDLPWDLALDVYRHFVGQDPEKEPNYKQMVNGAPLSADHVYRETKRAVERVNGRCDVYARVGFDLPMYPQVSTPKMVADATRAALEAGADGLFVAREFPEARRENLAAMGEVIDEWHATKGRPKDHQV